MIIVTGGSGFIGSALIWRLNQMGISDIIVVDHFGENEKFKNLIPLKFIDVFDREYFGSMVHEGFLKDNKIETIYHLGACSSTTMQDFNYLLHNNYEYSKFLCGNAVDNNIRFIYASSAATYGDGSNGYSDDESQLETLRPLNGYGYSKQLFDLWIKNNGFLDKVVGLKYFNVYGPNEYHKNDMRSVVSKSFDQIIESKKTRLFKSTVNGMADGEQKRDFIYVKDAVDMTLFFGENKIINGIYNIGTGNANSFNSLVKPIFKSLGIKENIEYFEMPEVLKNKYQSFTEADISKIRNAGYQKEITDITDAVTDYVSNYLNKEYSHLN
ncbi:MAG: ADP-glyceromanno-heptose 6-epimerase [Ignavibacteriae bacterium]|nr:ADP-glyceromanno-heptose 6-epimerase [Ignavibacteriota bacterium]